MAQLGITFDHNEVEGNDDFSPIPNGEYNAQIIESDVAETKNKKGTMLKLTWQIVDGEYENRRIWQNINYLHENKTAQKIGQGNLKQICAAFGIPGHVDNSEELHGFVARVKVGLSKPQEGYEQRNEIKKVSAYGEEAPERAETAPKETAPKQTAAKRPAAPAGRPWKKAA